MKRDMDLIRDLMLQVEAFPAGVTHLGSNIDLRGNDPQVVAEHLALLIEQGLIKGKSISGFDALAPDHIVIIGISWNGHEFLDSVRSETIWAKTKERVTKVGGSVSVATITEVASAIAKSLLNLPT